MFRQAEVPRDVRGDTASAPCWTTAAREGNQMEISSELELFAKDCLATSHAGAFLFLLQMEGIAGQTSWIGTFQVMQK